MKSGRLGGVQRFDSGVQKGGTVPCDGASLTLILDPQASPPSSHPCHEHPPLLLLGAAFPPQPQLATFSFPTPMTSPALTTTESLPADAGRSGPFDNHQEDVSEFGEENSETNDVGDDQAPKPQPQKRRRVTRACDECRRKKIKCDGKQPCTHCTVYSYGTCPAVLKLPTLDTC